MIVTISRKYGSAGKEIGKQLAKRLDIPFYDVDILFIEHKDHIEDLVRSLADSGPCVMVGFCAGYILSGTKGLLRVFIHCNMEHRIQRIMQQNNLSHNQASREALRQDREYAKLFGLYTGKKWTDPEQYDLTVDSSLLGISGTVELLSQFIALNVMRKRRGE